MPNRHSHRTSAEKPQELCPAPTHTHALRFRGTKEVTTTKTSLVSGVVPSQDEQVVRKTNTWVKDETQEYHQKENTTNDAGTDQMMCLLQSINILNQKFDCFQSTIHNKIERIETNYLEL